MICTLCETAWGIPRVFKYAGQTIEIVTCDGCVGRANEALARREARGWPSSSCTESDAKPIQQTKVRGATDRLKKNRGKGRGGGRFFGIDRDKRIVTQDEKATRKRVSKAVDKERPWLSAKQRKDAVP